MEKVTGIASLAIYGVLVLGCLGCAGSRAAEGVYRSELGRAPNGMFIVRVVSSILQSHGFQVQSTGADRLVTDWRTYTQQRVVNGASGRFSARTQQTTRARDHVRLLVRGRGGYVVAQWIIRHEVLTSGGWEQRAAPPSVAEQYQTMEQRITERLREYMTQL